MSLGPVDVDLLEHVELDSEAGSKLFDFTVRAGLLGSELVAGEGEDGQLILGLEKCISLMELEMVGGVSYLVVFVVQLYQLRVVGLSLSSLGGHIDDDTDLPSVLTEIHLETVRIRSIY